MRFWLVGCASIPISGFDRHDGYLTRPVVRQIGPQMRQKLQGKRWFSPPPTYRDLAPSASNEVDDAMCLAHYHSPSPCPNHPLASAIGARIHQKPRNGGFWPCCGRAMAFFFGLLDMDRLVCTICIDPCPMDGSPKPGSALESPNQVHVCAQFHCFAAVFMTENDLSPAVYIS